MAQQVTPLAGVWIEIWMASQNPLSRLVTPLAGVWIEIMRFSVLVGMSLVTPLAGVWIEIAEKCGEIFRRPGHSPCGSVD